MIPDFSFASTPEIIFGAGKLRLVTNLVLRYGQKVLLLTGAGSLNKSGKLDLLKQELIKESIQYSIIEINREPTPGDVNSIVKDYSDVEVKAVVAIGGGSVLDAGKAVSAMLNKSEPVEDFLEGVGDKIHDGSKIPFIAVPTTAGTGSEATKNAVLSEIGDNGYKKSMRHNNFVPNIALVDPELTIGCPNHITAACGLDAFTQLLESYVSANSSPVTDALALSGIETMKDSLLPASTSGAHDLTIRTAMSYGSLISGITLANAGLGIVHGLASSVGSFFDVPHGVVCGTLLGAATKINIEKLQNNHDPDHQSLGKYANVGRIFAKNENMNNKQACRYLIDEIENWIDLLKMPRLSDYGVRNEDVEKILSLSGNKQNPIKLEADEISKLILNRI